MLSRRFLLLGFAMTACSPELTHQSQPTTPPGARASVEEGPQVGIGDTAIPLTTYLSEAAGEVGLSIPEFSPRPPTPKGQFNEVTVNIALKGVTADELRKFLEKVETKQRIVVVTNLTITRQFRDNEKLDVDMTVATWEKIKPKKTEGAAGEGEAEAPAEEG